MERKPFRLVRSNYSNSICIAITSAFILLTSACSSSNTSSTANEAAAFELTEDNKTQLVSMLDGFMLSDNTIGSMLVINNGTTENYSVTRGFADKAADIEMTDQHQFHIASMSKPFTAVLLLQLIEEGQLSLDTTLSEALGTESLEMLFPNHEFTLNTTDASPVGAMTIDSLQQFQGIARGGDITMKMLMQHSHGMPDVTFDSTSQDTPSLAGYIIQQSLGLTDPQAALPEQWSGPALLEYYLASGLPQRSFFAPGEGYHYGDTGPVIAALIIERLTGLSLADAYRSRIFDRLAMNDTYLHHYETARQSDSVGLSHRYFDLTSISTDIGNVDVDASQWNTSIDWAGGGLVSTAADLDRFLRGLINGDLLENRGLLNDSEQWVVANDEFEFYGLGIGIRTGEADNSITSYDHGGFWGSYMAYFPKTDTSAVFTINQVEFDEFDTFVNTVGNMLNAKPTSNN